MRGFTLLADHVSPQTLLQLLNEYFDSELIQGAREQIVMLPDFARSARHRGSWNACTTTLRGPRSTRRLGGASTSPDRRFQLVVAASGYEPLTIWPQGSRMLSSRPRSSG